VDIKSFPFESKVDLDKNTFEGYAAVFGNIDSHEDIIEHGAFTKTLQEMGNRIKILWQHDPYNPIGLPMQMAEDSKGLFVKGKISQTTQGKDALILMKDGVINELSIGYNTIKHEMDEATGIRRLKELKLMEFSPVTWASNNLATITSAKSNIELESMLRDIKAGKVLSSKNQTLVQQAIEALKALLDAAEPEESTPKHKKPPLIIGNESDIHSILNEMYEFRKSLGGM
jgi:HK97 family phage prohead protease